MHYFPSMSYKKILWKISYANLMMLMATIPKYEKDKENTKHLGDFAANSADEFADFFK